MIWKGQEILLVDEQGFIVPKANEVYRFITRRLYPRIAVECVVCKRVVEKTPSRFAKNYSTCSGKCSMRRKVNLRWERNGEPLTHCIWCKRKLKWNQRLQGNKFCGAACWREFNRMVRLERERQSQRTATQKARTKAPAKNQG